MRTETTFTYVLHGTLEERLEQLWEQVSSLVYMLNEHTDAQDALSLAVALATVISPMDQRFGDVLEPLERHLDENGIERLDNLFNELRAIYTILRVAGDDERLVVSVRCLLQPIVEQGRQFMKDLFEDCSRLRKAEVAE